MIWHVQKQIIIFENSKKQKQEKFVRDLWGEPDLLNLKG